jgi:hypothetical protein
MDAAVAEVEGMGVPLGAVADDGDFAVPDEVEVSFIVNLGHGRLLVNGMEDERKL